MNMSFEFLSHTSEIILKVESTTKEGLFYDALRGEMSFLKNNVLDFEQTAERKIDLRSLDLETLFVDFLNEALYLADTHKELYFDMTINRLSDNGIEATLKGAEVNSFDRDIKAVTFHNLDIVYKDGKYVCEVVLDI